MRVQVKRWGNSASVRIPTSVMAAASLLLLIAAVNVTNLLLARSVDRERELSVQTALGASAWQLVRQAIAESLVLCGAGGVLGMSTVAKATPDGRTLLFSPSGPVVISPFLQQNLPYDATSFDLREFKARGGKLLVWHGWADGAIMATSSIGYYRGVLEFMGGRKQTEDFFRLFLVPGVHHSGGGPGFTEFDAMSALENWVEKGQPPDKLIACRSSQDIARRCRPIFPYPVVARYSGKGDPKQAQSFLAFDPTEP